MLTRKRILEIIEKSEEHDNASRAYEIFMLLTIVASVIPLMFMHERSWFRVVEIVTIGIFIIDYILRWITADIKLKKGGWSFLIYPVTPMAIIDMLSILPGLHLLKPTFKLFRLSRLLKIIRIFKLLRYTDKVELFLDVLKKEKKVLFSVLIIAVFYIFVTALVMFNAEPHINPKTGEQTFKSFFDAIYWATVTLTTVGYGDLCPVTDLGRFVSMLSSLFGVAIIALPSGVITASYLDELRTNKEIKKKKKAQEEAEKNNDPVR
jgi:voltage-gated potassium channel